MKVKVRKQDVASIVERTFPAYKGRKFVVEFEERVTFYDTNWSGGSRNSYAAVHVDGRTGRFAAPAPWVNPLEGKSVALTPEIVVVEHSMFCGRDMGITIHAHPCHAPRWLPEEVPA